ncbi:hydroxypyruvate isomerase [Duganella sp. BJB488]|uniref:2-oxo-tetronate isomerase n=1 Tax=unclassified Duganella TaxID=2636909 RepID=UPI000E351BA5|nr:MULTISPECIES: 2-oxo-tetronate isomerase [unclassified Duganella]RFP15122.1 hydroxypyruvate isomerase [Duganella sp. BJB489]RFP19676.1 hydroxypyruvate isomerase [Duganella sp. BJB488]RFP38066.1 hydroxypyruvate isomerase [Duganella sp. BJB480]
MPKFAANLSMLFTEAPFLDRFALAREAGFDGVEFLFPYAYDAHQLAERLRRHQLTLALFNLPAGDWNAGDRGMACDPRRQDEFRAGVRSALEYATELGATQLHCMAGKTPPGLAPERAHATYVDSLRWAAAELAPHGINLLIEPINHYDMPGYFLNRSRQALDIIAETGSPNLFLQYDIYHMQRMEGELSNTIRANLPMIKHMQIADTPGRHEPGSGEINYRHLFRLIDELGYDGWLGCEYLPAAGTLAGLGWRQALTS